MLYKNGFDLWRSLAEFMERAEELFIYVPYIKLEQLKELIDQHQGVRAVIVRWEPRDLITEASDLEVYPYLKSKGITLYRNPRLHLKAFVGDRQRAFFGSANISRRALNFPKTDTFNYELATVNEALQIDDRLYFSMIEAESVLITDHIYEQIKVQLPEKRQAFPKESDFQLTVSYPDKSFSIASLPMTYSVDTLYRIYETRDSIHETELNCAMHDLAIYRIPLGLPLTEFQQRLKTTFFQHPFIDGFLQYVDDQGETYFGGAKDWIHKNCSDVPTPRKWQITENIQILYRWITQLSNGRYEVDRPNHSERLHLIK
ncbi:MAG: hypothetical protein JWP94_518 [Mucilaginibacter sp.]|nr:hypothetical protein [Mucilaginibacter sp.]